MTEKIKNTIRYLSSIVCGLLLGIGIIAGIIWVGDRVTSQNTTREYNLSELQDGIYGIHVVSTSAIPAQNFEMVTVNIDGQIYTIKGNVNVYYTDEAPKIIWIDYNLVNGDTANLYVPEGTIRYDGTVVTK